MFDNWSHSSRSWACVRLNIHSWFLSETIKTYRRDDLRIAPSSELLLKQLGITFHLPRNYVWMTLIAKLVAIPWPLVTYRVPLVKCLITEVIPHGPEHACVWIYSWFLSESIETNSRETLRSAFESPRNCFWVTSDLPFESPSSEFRLRQLGITFESPRNYVWMTFIAKLVAITWPFVTYRVPLVKCLITEVIPCGPEHACVWIYIPVFYQRISKLTEEMPSELHLSHLGNAFDSPRNCFWVTSELPLSHLARNCVWDNSELRLSHLGITFESSRNYVWMTLIVKLVAITWPFVTYRVPPVNCLVTEVIPHGPAHEHACVWIYIPVFYHRLSKLTEEMTSELHLSHLGNAFESPRKCVWVTSESRLTHIERWIDRYCLTTWNISCVSS